MSLPILGLSRKVSLFLIFLFLNYGWGAADVGLAEKKTEIPEVSFGVMADIQYCDGD